MALAVMREYLNVVWSSEMMPEEYIDCLLSEKNTVNIFFANFLKFNRDHWGVEGHHFILELNWKEDRCTIRKGHGPENITYLRKLATVLIKSISKNSVSSTIERLGGCPRMPTKS